MILVGQYDSPYVRRVAISLHVLGLPFERNQISVFADAAAMRMINPLGRIPSLILDDGEVLVDSAAILDHLDEMAGPGRALLPAAGRERRRALQTIALASGIIDKIGAMAYERVLRPPEKVHEPWIDRCRTQAVTALAALEARIAGEPEAGRLTQAVITVGCMVVHLGLKTPELLDRGAYPALFRLSDACEATEAFRAARPTDREGMPGAPL